MDFAYNQVANRALKRFLIGKWVSFNHLDRHFKRALFYICEGAIDMKLSTKLIAGFAAVAVITAITGLLGLFGTWKTSGGLEEVGGVRLPSVQGLLMMAEGQSAAGMAMRTLTISELSIEQRKTQYERLTGYLQKTDQGRKIYEPLPQTPEEAKIWNEFVPVWQAWRTELDKAIALSRKFDAYQIDDAMDLKWNIKARLAEHLDWVRQLSESVARKTEFKGQLDHTQCNFGKWYYSYKADNPKLQEALKAIEEPHKHLHEMGKQIKDLMAQGKVAEATQMFVEVNKVVEQVKGNLDIVHNIAGEADKLMVDNQDQVLGPVADGFRKSNKYLDDLVKLNVGLANASYAEAVSGAKIAQITMVISVILAVIIALGLGVWLANSISRPIMGIVEELGEGSGQVTDASGQISEASQSLAEGATEQASSLEQTSAALEEITSMSRQNADNASHANSLAKDTRQEAEKGSAAMEEMTVAMKAINKSSQEISKIIKVIEEIAFQTNLLALNSAVEAARAGEHGKGFAVVAEEVRNLAQRAGAAAKDTASLIEDAVKKAVTGGEIADRAGKTLSGIVENVKKVTDLVGEIASASEEQSKGVTQVGSAITQMDKVTQQNASNAEQTAAASEELSAQAEALNGVVARLLGLVQGTQNGSHSGPAPTRKAITQGRGKA